MKLVVSTPLAIAVDTHDVMHVRAEDATGAFGILTGHADFLTALEVSVVTWRDGRDDEHHVAVNGGMLEVRGGEDIAIATREAVTGDDLNRLERDVLSRFRRQLADEQQARKDAQRLYLAAIRHIWQLVRPGPAEGIRGQRLGLDEEAAP